MKFEPTKESIEKHEVPQWYKDAKFGIFLLIGDYFLCLHGQERKEKIWRNCLKKGTGFCEFYVLFTVCRMVFEYIQD